jgi:cytochrome o ubiquinol oxidase subunit 1
MYVNLIWAWGHPEVYILILPAFGVFSEVVAVFSGKRLAGYTSMVISIWAIVFLSWLVWLHHFFTMGAPAAVNAFFGIMTAVIAVPTGVKIFNWLFTMYRGRVRLATPMLWFAGFVILFTLGGVAGVVLAEPPADYQLHNSLFLVAHFHTMIVSGVLFGYFAGLTYWFPKIFGFTLDESLGRKAFWCWLAGFILAFGPLYVLGAMGATRRLDHYSAALGWQPLFVLAGVGAALIALGFAFQIAQLLRSIRTRAERAAGPDPWEGRTLEWSVPSPAPAYNFARPPIVSMRDQWWAEKRGTALAPARAEAAPIELPANSAAGLLLAGCVFAAAFGLVWHIWWLAALGLGLAAACALARAFREEGEELLPAIL